MPDFASRWITAVPLLADQSALRNMGRNFRGDRAKLDSGDLLTGLLLVTVLIVGIWLLSRLLSQQERRQPYNSPRKLFRSLCRAQGLNMADRRLLWQLARSLRIEQPAEVFVEAGRFDADKLSPSLKARSAQLHALRDRLFAEGEPVAEPAAGKNVPGRKPGGAKR